MAASPAPIIRVVGRPSDRPPLPAGHPASWGAITAGTVLDGAAYPHPVFSDIGIPISERHQRLSQQSR